MKIHDILKLFITISSNYDLQSSIKLLIDIFILDNINALWYIMIIIIMIVISAYMDI